MQIEKLKSENEQLKNVMVRVPISLYRLGGIRRHKAMISKGIATTLRH